MVKWVLKSIWLQKTSFLASALGLGAALFFVMAFKALFLGETHRTMNYAKRMNADIWVMQKGVLNMHMARSTIWSWKAKRVAQIPGVKNVTPILYSGIMIKKGDKSSMSYVVGLNPNAKRAGPWMMHSGNPIPLKGEIVLPSVFQSLLNVKLGDTVHVVDRDFKVVGFSEETFSMANSITFLSFDDLQDLLSSIGSYSYFLVDLEPGFDAKKVAQEIERNVEKVTALPQEELLSNEFEMVSMMGIEMIALMNSIGSILTILILAFTGFTQVIRQRRELAILKALGFKNKSIYGAVLLYTFLMAMTGFFISLILISIIVPNVTSFVPQVKMMLSFPIVFQTGILAFVVAGLASMLPAYIVNHVEPVSAFKG